MTRTNSNNNSWIILLLIGAIAAFWYFRHEGNKPPVQGPPTKPGVSDDGSADDSLRKDDVKDLALGDVLDVPYILWGGDVATFVANGGATTAPGSRFDKMGLKLKLFREDDFDKQIKAYKEG